MHVDILIRLVIPICRPPPRTISLMNVYRIALILALHLASGVIAQADVTDFGTWSLVEDPAHPGFSATAHGTSATLSAADLAIPAGTDIGYQSVNGSTPQTSTSGFYFRPDADFSLAIDYAWTFSNSPSGFLGLGFGIGEDSDAVRIHDSGSSSVDLTNGLECETFRRRCSGCPSFSNVNERYSPGCSANDCNSAATVSA